MIFIRLLGGLLIGILGALYSLQFDQHFVDFVYVFFQQQFERNFACKAAYHLDYLSILGLQLQARNIHVQSPNALPWHWKAHRILLTNYWPWLLKKKLGLQIHLQNAHVFSSVHQNQLCIMEHLEKMMLDAQDIPIALKNLKLEHVIFDIQVPEQQGNFSCQLDGKIYGQPDSMHANLTMSHGSCILKSNPILNNLQFVLWAQKNSTISQMQAKGSCTLMWPHAQKYFLQCTLRNTLLQAQIKHEKNNIEAHISWDMQKNCGSWDIKGQAINLGPCTLAAIELSGKMDAEGLRGQGTVRYDAAISCDIDLQCTSAGNIKIICTNQLYNLHTNISYDTKSQLWTVTGSWRDYSFVASIHNDFSIAQAKIYWLNKKIIEMHDHQRTLAGTIDIDIAKQWLKQWGLEFRGGAPIDIALTHKKSKIILSVAFKNAHLHIPGTYNFIQDFSADCVINPRKKKLIIKNFHVRLHKGDIYSKRSVIHLDGDRYLHMPITFEDIFVNKTQEAMGFFSGALLINGAAHKPAGIATVFIDQASCKHVDIHTWLNKSSAMSFLSHQHLLPLTIQARVQTSSPIHIDMPFMNAQCTSNLSITYDRDMQASGAINIIAGTLHFPYRPLYITHGKIMLMPHQLHDPLIELVARGRIKKYQIIMRITGSVQDPHVQLESIPSLNDEQIITLLLSGSDKGSFAFAMPSVLLHNAHRWMFPQKSSSHSKFERYIRGFLAPFRNIRIIPSFIDQTSRGGFRGAIEISVSERLRAVIQKNFSLTEDTKLEVEYAVRDNITLRAIRDERGDLGGEVEMRWKF